LYPELFRIGNFPITTFGLMMFLSFVSGAWVTGKMLTRYGLSKELIWDMLPGLAIGGIVGAKAWYLALHWQDLMANPAAQIFSRGGLVWYGGLFGGVTAYYLQVRARKLPIPTMFDATAPALAVAYAVGRLGCFLVGDDYGVYTEGPWGLAFPEGASPPSTAGYLRSIGDSVPASIPDLAIVPVHPTQLYEIFLAMIIFGILWRLAKAGLRPGQLFAGFLGLYGIERFMIEFVRAKGDRFLFGLSTSQFASLLLIGAALWIWNRQKSAPEWTPPKKTVGARPAGQKVA